MTDPERRAMEDAIVRSIKIEHQTWLAQRFSYESRDGRTVGKAAKHRVETVGELLDELTGEYCELGTRSGFLGDIGHRVGQGLHRTDPETDIGEFIDATTLFLASLRQRPLAGLLGPSGEAGRDWAANADPTARRRLAALCQATGGLPILSELLFATVHGIGTVDAECKAWAATFWQRSGLGPSPCDAAVHAWAEGAAGRPAEAARAT